MTALPPPPETPRKRELTGPQCPCGGKVRRRRVWCIWDRAACQKCGMRFEVICALPLTFSMWKP